MTDLLVDLVSNDRINGCQCLLKLLLSECRHRKLHICLIEMISIPI